MRPRPSNILCFLLLILGAGPALFYPAVEVCARAKKERGTLETLLSSPAERIEIVGVKLLTRSCSSSMVTALC